MSVFTQGSKGDLSSPTSVFSKDNFKSNKKSQRSLLVKLDSKGRISIPSFLRKNFGLKEGDCVELVFDLEKDSFSVRRAYDR